jgi:hypothetical protein
MLGEDRRGSMMLRMTMMSKIRTASPYRAITRASSAAGSYPQCCRRQACRSTKAARCMLARYSGSASRCGTTESSTSRRTRPGWASAYRSAVKAP